MLRTSEGRGNKMATRTGALALALTLATGVSACSDSSDEERAVAALKAEMVANAAMTSGQAVDDEQTSCVAEGAVDALGVPTLQEYDLLTDDLHAERSLDGVELSTEDADALAAVFAECLDVEGMMERQIISGLDLPRAQRREAAGCVRETVTADQVESTLSLEFQGQDNPVFAQLRGRLESCLR